MTIKKFEQFNQDSDVEEITRDEFFDGIYCNSIYMDDDILYGILGVIEPYDSMFSEIEQSDREIMEHSDDNNFSIRFTNFEDSGSSLGDCEILVWMNSDNEVLLEFNIENNNKYYRIDIGFGVEPLYVLLNELLSAHS